MDATKSEKPFYKTKLFIGLVAFCVVAGIITAIVLTVTSASTTSAAPTVPPTSAPTVPPTSAPVVDIKLAWDSSCVPIGDPSSISTRVSPVPEEVVNTVKNLGLHIESKDSFIGDGMLYLDCVVSDHELMDIAKSLEDVLGNDNYAMIYQRIIDSESEPICLITILKDFTASSDWTPLKIEDDVYLKKRKPS